MMPIWLISHHLKMKCLSFRTLNFHSWLESNLNQITSQWWRFCLKSGVCGCELNTSHTYYRCSCYIPSENRQNWKCCSHIRCRRLCLRGFKTEFNIPFTFLPFFLSFFSIALSRSLFFIVTLCRFSFQFNSILSSSFHFVFVSFYGLRVVIP